MSEEPPLCKICLRTDRRLEKVDEKLADFHDEQTDYANCSIVSMFCWECKYLLKKWYYFKDRCVQSEIILQKWIQTKHPNKRSIHNLHKSIRPSPLGLCRGRNKNIHDVTYCEQEIDTSSLTSNIVDCSRNVKLEIEDLNYNDAPVDETVIKLEYIDTPDEEPSVKLASMTCSDKSEEETLLKIVSKDPAFTSDKPDEEPVSKIKLSTGKTSQKMAKPTIKRNMPINQIIYKRKRRDLNLNELINQEQAKTAFKLKANTVTENSASNETTVKKTLQIMLKKKKPIVKPVLKFVRADEVFKRNTPVVEALITANDPVLKVNVPFVEPVARGMLTVGPITCRLNSDPEVTSITPSDDMVPLIVKIESFAEEILPDKINN